MISKRKINNTTTIYILCHSYILLINSTILFLIESFHKPRKKYRCDIQVKLTEFLNGFTGFIFRHELVV